ncbi:NACHT domain-containing protein [Nonomuraea thailandensis]
MPSALRAFYGSLTERLVAFLNEAGAHDSADRIARVLADEVPQAAMRRYEHHLRVLASDFPEVAFWANRLDHLTTHDRLLRLHAGMEGLGRVLEEIASSAAPMGDRRAALARRYRRVLERPIVATGDVPEGLTIPSLATAYVNPRFRAADVTHASRFDQEQWWSDHPVRDDLQEFLIGHLTSIAATRSPLIVLGQPGSGKSVLTQILAARLPAADFLAVRVALRDVPADTDLQSQIEHAIRDSTGESVTWPALAGQAGGALPVVLLDGFDELLQATGIGQTDYLEQVVRFQEREADQGRPVAVLVTSRIAVADRARVAVGGATALRLEPFTGEQVEQWLAVWGRHNAAHLAGRGLRALPAEAALRQPELAVQPLLLLMLALYDAADNALQRHTRTLDQADLYERILRRFAERELQKTRPELAGAPLRAEIENELLRLSIAGFAMFNRGRQWVTEEELSADLTALSIAPAADRAARGFHAPPTPAQQVIGRFFFIHQAQALRKDARLTTCEFLHATFGEFLVARLILRELVDLAAAAAARSRHAVDDGFVRTLLSFLPLTTRGQIITFLQQLAGQVEEERRPLLRELLLTAFHGSLRASGSAAYASYRPEQLGDPARHGAYAANLLLLIVLIGGPVHGRELFPRARFPAAEWRRHALLWRSQFTAEAWEYLAAFLSLERTWYAEDREVRIGVRGEEPWSPPEPDVYWMHFAHPGHEFRQSLGWQHTRTHHLFRESHFTCDYAEDLAWHALTPLVTALDYGDSEDLEDGESLTAIGVVDTELALSTTNALTRVWLASSDPTGESDLQRAYEECLTVVVNSRPDEDSPARTAYLSRFLRQLAADRDRLSPEFRSRVREHLDRYLVPARPLVRGWARRPSAICDALGRCGAQHSPSASTQWSGPVCRRLWTT